MAKYLLALVMVLVFVVGAVGQGVSTYLGQYAPAEVVTLLVPHIKDSTAGTSPNLRIVSRYPDTLFLQCWRNGTKTYQSFDGSMPFTGLTSVTFDTSKWVFSGSSVDTTYALRYSVTTLNNGSTTGCLACELTAAYNGTTRRVDYLYYIQVMPDTVNLKLSRSLLASGSGTSYLKVDSIVGTKVRIATAANATFPAVSISGDTAAAIRLITTTGPTFHLKPTTGAGVSITPTTGNGIDISPTSTGLGINIATSGIGFRVASTADDAVIFTTSAANKWGFIGSNTKASGNGFNAGGIKGWAAMGHGIAGFRGAATSGSNIGGLTAGDSGTNGGGFHPYASSASGDPAVQSNDVNLSGVGSMPAYLVSGAVDAISANMIHGLAATKIRDSILNRLNDSVWMSKKGFGAVKGIVTGGGSDSGCYSATFTAATNFYTNKYLVQCFYGTGANQMAIVTRTAKNTGDTIRWLPKFGTAVATDDSIRLIPLGALFYGGPARAVNDSNIMLATDNPTLASSQAFNNTGTWTGNLTGSVGSVTGAVGSVTGAVGSVTGNVGGSVGSVTADVGITQAGADKVWNTATRILTAGTNIVLAKGTGVTGFNDITAADVWASVTRTLTAVPTGGALEASVTKVRDSLTILASDARLKKIDSISNLIALCNVIKASVDTSIAAAGWQSTSSSTQGFSTDTDTLHIWWGPTELLKTLFWHVGKGPGSVEIDSTRVFWLP